MKQLFGLMVLVMTVLLAAPFSYAVPVQYIAHLDGPSENPPNSSPGIGTAFVEIDTMAHTLKVNAVFSGLVSPTMAAHIHCCTLPPNNAGVVTPAASTFQNLPLGVMSGTVIESLNTTLASTFRTAFITANGNIAGAEMALAAGLEAGLAYFNIHTVQSPGGEIRGFLQPVPEPGTLGLLAIGITALGVVVRRRRG